MAYYSCGLYGGSFNPLHLGHVRCMISAANQCARLIVVISEGVNRDEIDIRQRYRWVYETVKHFESAFPPLSRYCLPGVFSVVVFK